MNRYPPALQFDPHRTSSSTGGYAEAIGGIFSSLSRFLGTARRNNCVPPTAAGLKYKDTVKS